MDTSELVAIAKTFSDAIITQGLTKAELVMLNSLIAEMTSHKLEVIPEAILEAKADEAPGTLAKTVAKTVYEPPPKAKSIAYDDNPSSPTYNPAPAMDVDKVPPRAEATGKIIAKEGEACICKKCGKIVYTVTRDIPDNCKATDFFNSFTPFGKAPVMPDRLEISNTEGMISTNCPICSDTKKSLFLVGGNNAKQGDIISV